MDRADHSTTKRPAVKDVSLAEVSRAVTDGDIVLASVDVKASPERVFRALMSEECERWWGAPGIYSIESFQADLRTGGAWSLVIRLPDGTALPASGEFVLVDAPSRVVQTRRYDWDHPALGRRATRVTTLLRATETGTNVTVRHEDFGSNEAAFEHAGGWERLLAWLAGYLDGRGGGS